MLTKNILITNFVAVKYPYYGYNQISFTKQ